MAVAITTGFTQKVSSPGLHVTINAGDAVVSGAVVRFPTGDVSLAPNTTTYVYLNFSAGAIQTSTSAFLNGAWPICTAVTNATDCISVTDMRPDAFGGGGTSSPWNSISPSGDTTGATDTAAISAAIVAGGPIFLKAGTFHINAGFTISSPILIEGAGPGSTIITNHSATADIFVVNYQFDNTVSPFNPNAAGCIIRDFSIIQAAGVTPTGGFAFNVASQSGGTFYTAGLHVENVHMRGLYGGVKTGTGVISCWFRDLYIYNTVSVGISYNTPVPGGDCHFENCEMAGTNTGLTIIKGEVTEFTNLKINGSGIVMAAASSNTDIAKLRFLNISIEGTGSVPTYGVDFGANGCTNCQFIGGQIDLVGTSSFGNQNNAVGLQVIGMQTSGNAGSTGTSTILNAVQNPVLLGTDAGISRLGAGNLAIGGGSAGDYAGTLKVSTLNLQGSGSNAGGLSSQYGGTSNGARNRLSSYFGDAQGNLAYWSDNATHTISGWLQDDATHTSLVMLMGRYNGSGTGDYLGWAYIPAGGSATVTTMEYSGLDGTLKLGGTTAGGFPDNVGGAAGTAQLAVQSAFGTTTLITTILKAAASQSVDILELQDSNANVLSAFGSDGRLNKYKGVATVSAGVPSEVATVDSTGLVASTGTVTLYAVPASGAGQYRVSWNAKITTAGTSPVIGPLTITYTDPDGTVCAMVVPSSNSAGTTSASGNAANSATQTGVMLGCDVLLNCKASTNIQYSFPVSGTVGPGAWNLHIKCESLG